LFVGCICKARYSLIGKKDLQSEISLSILAKANDKRRLQLFQQNAQKTL
jgi:hypothetical protein